MSGDRPRPTFIPSEFLQQAKTIVAACRPSGLPEGFDVMNMARIVRIPGTANPIKYNVVPEDDLDRMAISDNVDLARGVLQAHPREEARKLQRRINEVAKEYNKLEQPEDTQ